MSSVSRILNTPPFNKFTLNCEILTPSNLKVKPDLIWKLDGKAINRTDHLTSSVNITPSKTESELVATGLTLAGVYVYSCAATLHIGTDPVREYIASTRITVSGKFTIAKQKAHNEFVTISQKNHILIFFSSINFLCKLQIIQ